MRSQRTQRWRRTAAAIACAAGFTSPAFAQFSAQGSDWGTYVGGSAGVPEFGDIGLKAFFGQQLHKYFGWEVSAVRFARETQSTPAGDVRTDLWGLGGAAVGILPVNAEFSAFGKLGLMGGRKRIRGPGGDRDENEVNLLVGIGARYAITRNVALRIEYEDFNQGNLLSAGASYRF
jgi:OOP family OmpA-OmpF porin